jgi:histidine triad (HIT) family protein
MMADADCIFCKIIDGAIPSPRVHEDDHFIVIRDIQPQARYHFLVIPKLHIRSLSDVPASSAPAIFSGLLQTAVGVADSHGLSGQGYRTVINTREWGGQTVHHLHLHLLGGQQLRGGFA